MNRHCLAMTLWAVALPLAAQEPTVTLQSTVTGNREQPRVMYILPWQQPEAVEFEQSLDADIASGVFQTLDREEFQRDLRLRRRFQGEQISAETATQD